MGQCGQLVFFSEIEQGDPCGVLRAALVLTGSQTAWFVTRSLCADRSWDAFQEELQREREVVETDEDLTPSETLGEGMPIDRVPELYVPGRTLSVHFARSDLETRIHSEISGAVPESVRGDFVPARPIVTIGWHDVFEWAENDAGHFFGRSFFSFSLFGQRSPNDWNKCRELLPQVPMVRELRQRIESIVGAVEHCIFWNI
jgi:hypothetical protein